MNTGTVPTEEIRKALKEATPGPWEIDEANNVNGPDTGYGEMRIATLYGTARREQEHNAHLIANAPTWLRSLLEENERLRQALIKERDDAMIWDGITVVDRINKVLSQYAINESKPDTATTPLG